jgi:hypothetical protein
MRTSARVICNDAQTPDFPIVALIRESAGSDEKAVHFTAGGHFYNSGNIHHYDLINAPAPKRFVYVNVYEDGMSLIHFSRKAADDAALGYHRIGCNRIELEPGRWDE